MIIVKAAYVDGTAIFKTFFSLDAARVLFNALRYDVQTTHVSINWA